MTDIPARAGLAPSARATLTLLAFANFVVGMGAFVVIGVLTPVAGAFSVGQAEAGWLMTAYAIVYAVSSPILVALTGGMDRRRVLTIGVLVFLGGSILASAAPTFEILLVARALQAIGGGLVTPVAASVGAALAPPEQRGRALATVFGGLTLAQVLGVPVGAWLGYALGWRVAFEVVAALSIAALVLVRLYLPTGLSVPRSSLKALGEVLADPKLLLAVSFTAFFIGGLYVLYTFLGPFLEGRLGLGRDGVTAMLLVFGAGAVVGNALGGVMTDRIGGSRTLAILCLAQMALMPLLSGVAFGLVATGVVVAVWSLFAWSFMVAQQARLSALDPPRTPLLFALNAAALYVGGSLGSLVGGAILKGPGFTALGFGGAAMVAVALVSLVTVARTTRSA